MIATEPRIPAAATSVPSLEIASAITGVGEQAYWVGSPLVGALYVLKGNTFLRISVGGVREEPVRIQKSVALARLALKRL